jgi:hypothetical protein
VARKKRDTLPWPLSRRDKNKERKKKKGGRKGERATSD